MKTLISLVLLSVCLSFGAEKNNSYIKLTDKAMWSFKFNDHLTIIQIKGKERVGGKECYKVEWHQESPDRPPMRIEYWYAKGDSIFCAGIRGFGTTIAYPSPLLVLAETTKPGDSWKFVNGKGAFADTVVYKAESFDSVYVGSRNVVSLKISRNGRGSVQSRYFAPGLGIVMEETSDAGNSSPFQQAHTFQSAPGNPGATPAKGESAPLKIEKK